MLHDFISSNRDELISRTRAKVSRRPAPPSASSDDREYGVPRFLSQLAEALRLEETALPFSPGAIEAAAGRHGRDLLAMGCTTLDLVHDYGDLGQAITELVLEKSATIDPLEFRTLNRCLDTAIGEAVTEYERLKDEVTAHRDLEQRGRIAHDLRSVLQTALLSFQVVQRGNAGASGNAGARLGRSLVEIRDLIDAIAAEARPAAAAPADWRPTVPEKDVVPKRAPNN
jgi:hypothetical protein